MKFDIHSRFIAGFVIYFTYGIWQSSERGNTDTNERSSLIGNSINSDEVAGQSDGGAIEKGEKPTEW